MSIYIFLICCVVFLALVFRPMFRAVIVFLLICAVLSVARMDYRDEQLELRDYCIAVATKRWPDYKAIYSTECRELFESSKARKEAQT